MHKYVLLGTYNSTGAKGLLEAGASAREEAIAKLAASVGGTVDSVHFTVGAPGYLIIMNLPDRASATAIGAAVQAAGAVTLDHFLEILTPRETDDALKKTVQYRAPGR
jgi:uncharacterized protein with GYD domain